MRIGILTFFSTKDNYGQLFQSYALQKFLQIKGHDAYIIRYIYQPSHSLAKRIVKFLLIYPIIRAVINYKDRQWRILLTKKNEKRNFETFRERYIRQSIKTYSCLKELIQDAPIADCYIAGSDQIWSFLSKDKEYSAYFLAFGSNKTRRISYAASFGMTHYPEAFKPILKNELKRFSHISVREADGIQICNDVGYKAEQVLDPTFLLNPSIYISLLNPSPVYSGKYAYLYILNVLSSSDIKWEIISPLLKEISIQPIMTISSGCLQAKELFNVDNYCYATPEEWLTNIYYSELVITTSFHGVAFSLIFHKNFIFFPLKNKFSRGNNRVYDLLNKVGLLEKIISDKTDLKRAIEIPIYWQNVENHLNKLREQSEYYLTHALKS